MAFKPKQWTQREFTEGLKKEVKEKGLIQTGALYESIDCSVEIDEYGVMTVTIYAMPYLKYLWFEYSLDKFVRRGTFVWAAYAQWTAYKVKRQPLLDWKVTDPKIEFEIID